MEVKEEPEDSVAGPSRLGHLGEPDGATGPSRLGHLGEESSAERNRRLATLRKRKQRSEDTVGAIREAERVQKKKARICACA